METKDIFDERKLSAAFYLDCMEKVADIYGKVITEFGDLYGLYGGDVNNIQDIYIELKSQLRDYMRQIQNTAHVTGLDEYQCYLIKHEYDLLHDIEHGEGLFNKKINEENGQGDNNE